MMDKKLYEYVFSSHRMEKYFNYHPKNEQDALWHYNLNIKLSEAFYPCLSIFEVAFRNSLNRELSNEYGVDWFLRIGKIHGLSNLKEGINAAKRRIEKRNEAVTANKIVAELTLGFWVRLLNVEYELILWKHLRKAFPNLAKKNRQRRNVSAPINKIRNFRNRVFHHESISWNLNKLEEIHEMILEVISWFHINLSEMVGELDNVQDLINKAKGKLTEGTNKKDD